MQYLSCQVCLRNTKGCQRLIANVNTHTGLLLMLYLSLIDYSVSYCPTVGPGYKNASVQFRNIDCGL